jgi:hypothetical protein
MPIETHGLENQNKNPPIEGKSVDKTCDLASSEFWPIPKWERREIKSQNKTIYKEYLATQLRARYSEIVTEFRTEYPYCLLNKRHLPTSQQIVYLLSSAREILEKGLSENGFWARREYLGKQDLLVATNLLDLAEECMVWLYRKDNARTQIPALITRIEHTKNLDEKDKRSYIEKLEKIWKEGDIGHLEEKNQKNDIQKLENTYETDNKEQIDEDFRPIFEQVIWVCNQKNLEDMINIGLQIERLKYYVHRGIILLIILFLAFPLICNLAIFNTWSSQGNYTTIYSVVDAHFTGTKFSNNGNWTMDNLAMVHLGDLFLLLFAYLAAIEFGIIGAIAGYLSGLIQTRKSRTNLAFYEESVLLSRIRLLFGAFMGMISCAFLSWNLLSGIDITSPGPFVLTAFLSGFSERYLLNLLKIEPDKDQEEQLQEG